MWQYPSIGAEGTSAGPSTSSGHPGTASGHHPGSGAPGTQPELTDMLQILDQSGPTSFDDLGNMFNTNFEWGPQSVVLPLTKDSNTSASTVAATRKVNS